jgi:S1-C subfamily serine protease
VALLRTWVIISVALFSVALFALGVVAVFGINGSNTARQLGRSQSEVSQLRADVKRLQQTLDAQEDLIVDAEHVIAEVAPSVVTLFTPDGLGTGFVVKSEDGASWIATNFHVVSRPRGGLEQEIVVEQNGSKWDAGLEHWSEEDDLAIVRIHATLPALDLAYGVGSDPHAGDWVVAYGSPAGLQGTATIGIISALRPGWVQTDAQINQGNSGGPLVDRDSRVVGITSLGFVSGGSGLGFAVDARKLCPLLAGIDGCG